MPNHTRKMENSHHQRNTSLELFWQYQLDLTATTIWIKPSLFRLLLYNKQIQLVTFLSISLLWLSTMKKLAFLLTMLQCLFMKILTTSIGLINTTLIKHIQTVTALQQTFNFQKIYLIMSRFLLQASKLLKNNLESYLQPIIFQ